MELVTSPLILQSYTAKSKSCQGLAVQVFDWSVELKLLWREVTLQKSWQVVRIHLPTLVKHFAPIAQRNRASVFKLEPLRTKRIRKVDGTVSVNLLENFQENTEETVGLPVLYSI